MTHLDRINLMLDEMYNMRSNIRAFYLSLTAADELDIHQKLNTLVASKLKGIASKLKGIAYTLNINLKEFYLSVDFDDITVISQAKKRSLVEGILNELRTFIDSKCTNVYVQLYLKNEGNPIADQYTVGNSIKFLL